MLPYKPEAYRLLHQGAVALARVSANGIRIDTEYLEEAIARQHRRIKARQDKLNDSTVMVKWRNHYRSKTNFNSREQLGYVLFELLGHDCPKRTASGGFSTEEESLAKVDDPFVKRYLDVQRIQTGVRKLEEVRAEVVDGLLRSHFNLHIARTYRSSSSKPNFQNFPVRNEELKNIVRRCIIARPGRCIVETDYSGIEVRIAACYHNDPTMIKYIKDPSTDMHRDMAMECFKLEQQDISKLTRYSAKNQFVFPQFYGAWWLDCAAGLWDMVRTLGLKRERDGVDLYQHLQSKGIKELGSQTRERPEPEAGSFGDHIKRVERRFWEKRFPTYAEWKRKWFSAYQKRGWFTTKTGFICQGFMKRNDVINYPVQGPAFHCLLQALIWMDEEIRRRKMDTLLVGQIHDSLLGDVPEDEVEKYNRLSEEMMITRLLDEWRWINVPLEIEIEATPVGGSWVDKKEIKKAKHEALKKDIVDDEEDEEDSDDYGNRAA